GPAPPEPGPPLQDSDHRRDGAFRGACPPLALDRFDRGLDREPMGEDRGLERYHTPAGGDGAPDLQRDLERRQRAAIDHRYILSRSRGRSRTGTGARPRTVWGNPWRFESSRPQLHHASTAASRLAASASSPPLSRSIRQGTG